MSLYQKHFIDIISEQLPDGVKLVDFLSDLLHLSKEACYRRIRCEVEFTLSEVVLIAKTLNINLTSLVIREGGDKVTCNLRVNNRSTYEESYIKKIEGELNVLEGFDAKTDNSLVMVCKELPELFYLQTESLFKLSLMKILLNIGDQKMVNFKQVACSPYLKKIQDKYWQVLKGFDLVFYLGPDLFNSLLYDIEYFYKTNLLSSQDRQQILQDILVLVEDLSEVGRLGKFREKDVELYLSYLDIGVTHTYLKARGLEATVVNLSTPNSILSFDSAFNKAQEQRLSIVKKVSTLITRSGEIEKTTFLNKQRELIKSIKSK